MDSYGVSQMFGFLLLVVLFLGFVGSAIYMATHQEEKRGPHPCDLFEAQGDNRAQLGAGHELQLNGVVDEY